MATVRAAPVSISSCSSAASNVSPSYSSPLSCHPLMTCRPAGWPAAKGWDQVVMCELMTMPPPPASSADKLVHVPVWRCPQAIRPAPRLLLPAAMRLPSAWRAARLPFVCRVALCNARWYDRGTRSGDKRDTQSAVSNLRVPRLAVSTLRCTHIQIGPGTCCAACCTSSQHLEPRISLLPITTPCRSMPVCMLAGLHDNSRKLEQNEPLALREVRPSYRSSLVANSLYRATKPTRNRGMLTACCCVEPCASGAC